MIQWRAQGEVREVTAVASAAAKSQKALENLLTMYSSSALFLQRLWCDCEVIDGAGAL